MEIALYSQYMELEPSGRNAGQHQECVKEAVLWGRGNRLIAIADIQDWHSRIFTHGGELRRTEAHTEKFTGQYFDHENPAWVRNRFTWLTADYLPERPRTWYAIAEFHWLLWQCHPFTDGNKRIMRLVLNWHSSYCNFGMVLIKNRAAYLKKLHAIEDEHDSANIQQLANFFKAHCVRDTR